jgi:ABC-type transporter Mla MlaB component
MSFHFCAHAWEVSDVADGIVVRLRNRDLNPDALQVLVDELVVLVRESGKANLYLDFANIGLVDDEVPGKLADLNAELRRQGSQLALINLNSRLRDMAQTLNLADDVDQAIHAAGAMA